MNLAFEKQPFGLVFEGCTRSSGVKIHVGAEGWFRTWFWGCLQGRLVEPWSGGPSPLTSGTTALEAYSRLGLGFDPPNCFFCPCSQRGFGFVWIWEEEGRGACTCICDSVRVVASLVPACCCCCILSNFTHFIVAHLTSDC